MNNIKCIIFDFDDTIVFSEKMKLDTFLEISNIYNDIGLNYYNNNINNKLSREQFLKGLSEIIIKNSLIDSNSARYFYNILLDKFNNIITNKLKYSQLIPNIDNFLKLLYDKGYKLYISSKSIESDIISTLKHKDLFKYFHGIYGKPYSKDIHFKLIRDIENIKNNNIYFFGDSLSDYNLSIEEKCNFIGIIAYRNELKDINCNKIKDYNEIKHLF